MSEYKFMKDLLSNLIKIFEPIIEIDSIDYLCYFFQEFGWDIKEGYDSIIELLQFDNFSVISSIVDGTSDIEDNIIEIVESIKGIFTSIRNLSQSSSNLPEIKPFTLSTFWETFPEELMNYLIINFFRKNYPFVFGILTFLGIFSEVKYPGDDDRLPYIKKNIHWERFSLIFGDFKGLMKAVYKWDHETENFDYILFMQNLKYLICQTELYPPSETLMARYYNSSSEYNKKISETRTSIANYIDINEDGTDFAFIDLVGLPIPSSNSIPSNLPVSDNDKPVGIMFGIDANASSITSFDLTETLKLILTGEFESECAFRLEIRPQGVDIVADQGGPITDINLGATLDYDPPTPKMIFGSPDGTRFEIEGFNVKINLSGKPPDTQFGTEIELIGGKLVIQGSDGDGFINKILPEDPLIIDFDFKGGYSPSKGLYMYGGAGFEYTFIIDKQLGPILINSVDLKLNLSGENISLILGVSGAAKLGPVSVVVKSIGLEIMLELDKPGILGNSDLSFKFKLPDGIGIAIDANGVKGAGYIWRDKDQYAGVLEISIFGINASALAVINTKPEVSFIFAIFSDFEIQLGAGFKIQKLGGLLGINRTVSHNEIASGIQSGILDDILFPSNVVENASRIIQNYIAAFPVQQNQHLFGPALRIAYGTPTIIAADLAIIFEFPNPFVITILGKVTSRIPEQAPLIKLNLGIIGAIDFTNKYFGVYGSLYDSRLAMFTLSGDMGCCFSWGAKKNFIFSIGGFHPRYTPPENFPPFGAPPLERLQIAFSKFVTLQTYIAITTNTFQVGARLDARFSGKGAEIYGYLGFDALIQFSPIFYIVEVFAGFGVKFKRWFLFSIDFFGSLEGPNPHRLKGKASFSILWWDVTVKVKKTFGIKEPEPIKKNDPWELLEPALNQKDFWEVELPEWADVCVTLNKPPEEMDLLHPLGKLKFSQRAVPINYTMDWVVAGEPKNFSKFKFEPESEGQANGLLIESITKEEFAPAHWKKMTPEQKLAAKNTDWMESGIIFRSEEVKFETSTQKDVEYETIMISKAKRLFELNNLPVMPYLPTQLDCSVIQMMSGSYQNIQQSHNNKKYCYDHISPAASITEEKFIIVNEDLQQITDQELMGEFSQAVATNILEDYMRNNPEDPRYLHVISKFELEGALV